MVRQTESRTQHDDDHQRRALKVKSHGRTAETHLVFLPSGAYSAGSSPLHARQGGYLKSNGIFLRAGLPCIRNVQ